jgi:glycosyltransferase involved in cell wall biosynthesis
MKVAFVLPPVEPFSPRGLALSTIVSHTAVELIELGHEPHVVSAADPLGVYDVAPVRQVHLDERPRWQRRVRRALDRRVGSDWPDQARWNRAVGHELQALGGELEAVVALNDVQIHRHLRDVVPHARRFTWLQNELGTRNRDAGNAFAAADGFVCCSGYIRDQAASLVGDATLVHVVPNCVDTTVFFPGSIVRPGTGALRLLFVGRVEPNKGPDALVAAAHLAQARGAAIDVTIAGPLISYSLSGAAYAEWVRRLLDDLAAIGGEYLGHVQRPDLPALYRANDVSFVLSRSQEPFGLVALEAMASGNLVAASPRGGLPEATGGHAIYLQPDDIEGIAQFIASAAQADPSFAMMRSAGAAWAAGRGWDVAARDLVAVLEA